VLSPASHQTFGLVAAGGMTPGLTSANPTVGWPCGCRPTVGSWGDVIKRLVVASLLITLAAGCSSPSGPAPADTTSRTTSPLSPATQATGSGAVASLIDDLAGAGLSCERVDMAGPEILASGAREEAEALCAGESLDIAVFPTAEQADEYGRQAGYPYVGGEGWVIITETQALAEQIAEALHGSVG
jgi:hypothetical protein